MKHTHPPFFFPESSLFLSARCTENLAGFMDGDSISRETCLRETVYVTIPYVSLEANPHPELVYFIIQRLNIAE
jgi:hypothetical protein